MIRSRLAAATVLAAILGFAQPATAALILGQYLGNGTGDNDSEAQILADFGLEVEMLARIGGDTISQAEDENFYFNEGLTIFDLFKAEEWAGGTWTYDGPEIASILAVKAGPDWGLWLFTPEDTDNMPNMGLFDTAQLDPPRQRGFGDVTVYRLVPEPSALALVGLGLVGLGITGRRRGA